MKKYSSFILTALCCMMALLPTLGAKAVEIVDAEVDFSKYTDISQVIASGRATESAFARLSIKDGCLHFESSVATDPSWDCQFFPIGGVIVDPGVTYTLHYKIKGDHKGNISALGFGVYNYGQFPITTEWVEGTVDFTAVNTDGNILIQCGDWIGSWDIAYLKITHLGKPEAPIEWVEMLTNGDAEMPWKDPDVRCDDQEENYKICAWAKEKDVNMNLGGGWDPFPATIEPEEGNPSNHVFVVHGKQATTAGAWDNQFWIQSPKAWKTGSQVKVSFRYKASKKVTVATMCDHQTPSDYLIYHAIGDISFTEEWQEYSDIMTILDDMNGVWSIRFVLNQNDKDAIDFYFDDLSWQGMKLDEGLFVAAANPDTGIDYDFDNATELVYNDDLAAYVATVGTVGNQDSWVNQVMVSTFRGNDYAFKGATIRPTGIIDGSDETWLNYTESPYAVINLPAAGVWQIAIDTESEQCNFYQIEGDEIEKPLEEIPNPTEVVVHGLERDAVTGQSYHNAFYIVSNRPLEAGESTIVKFKYKSSIPAHTTTSLYGDPGAYMHYKAIGDVDFTTEWQDFYTTLIVPAEADGMKSICFNMAEIKDACDYYIKDVIWMTEDHFETLIDVEGTKNFYVKEGAKDIIHEFGHEPEVYTEFVEETGTLTYYYDWLREYRSGVTEVYDPEVTRFNGYKKDVLKAVIDPSMKEAPLTSTKAMFYDLSNMTSIEGLENLNTSGVTNMEDMFENCMRLEKLDVSSFDVGNVKSFMLMFSQCTRLSTIICYSDWSTSSAQSGYMFYGCRALCGGKGTAYTNAVTDKTYARPDGGTEAPGYFTDYIKGDANGDGVVDVADVVAIVNYILEKPGENFNFKAADVNGDEVIDAADVVGVVNIILDKGSINAARVQAVLKENGFIF